MRLKIILPDWSPDGEWIAYTSGTSAQYDVWIIHTSTKKKFRLTTEPKRNETPVWKPELRIKN
ncbi:MAG: PD40 domain-containing protein [Bacteroidetes bacterium]|nr:PD40 domain-containing protein [Bacteroidota bacterium]